MMGSSSRLWFSLQYSGMCVLIALSGVSGQSSECNALKPVFPRCSCNRNLDSTGFTSVDCSYQGLNIIPSSTTRFSFYELKLNNNSIVSLGDSILSNVDITRLDLSDNAISSVHDHAFGYLGSHLKILILSGNGSSQPPKNSFQYLPLLEDLTLQNYNVPDLTVASGYFLSLTKLTQLTLDNWKLKSIDPGSIQLPSSTRLQSLTLLNQPMVTLPLGELHSNQLQDLRTLRVSYTNIPEITHESFSDLNSLTELDLSNNNISSLEAGCFTGVGDTLVKLSLSNNKLTSTSLLPGLADLKNLQVLDLSFNNITNIPDLSMIHTSKPLALYLSHNSITDVPVNAFTGIADKLKTIDLSYNRISTFQASFVMFTQIESLFLAHQSINTALVLPTSLRQTAGTLKELYVGGQNISKPELWAVIRELYMLEVLNLTSTGLTNIPNLILSNLTYLNTLDLSYNSLQNITQNTLAGPRNSLKLLILTRNSISTLLPCVLYQYTSYPISLFWGDNRLSCDCSVKWLWNSTRNGNIISIPGQEAVCSGNQPLANKSVEIFCASPYTEPQCFEYYTTTIAPSPKLTIVVETIGQDSIKISWQLSETSDDLKEFTINVADSYSVSTFFQTTIPASSTSQEVNKLVGKINYEVCVKAYFNRIPTLSSCTRTSVPGNSTLSEEQTPGTCVLIAQSGVSGQSSECNALKPVFPRCSCNRNLDSTGVPLVTSVDCSSQGLSVLPNFTTRFSFYELKLNNNSIVTLGDSILSNLGITRLDLSDNAISSVHAHAFGYLGSHLKILILSGNGSSQPPKNAFQYLPLLEDLTLQNYNVPDLTVASGYFLSLTKLTQLTLDNWKLKSIDPGSIQLPSSTRLQSLTLLNQPMVTLPLGELHSNQLQDLRTLRVSYTNIPEITHESFSDLNSLTELDLSNNNISSLEAGCFTGVGDTLVKLSLSNNKLTSTSLLPGLADLTNLQVLDLSFNQITNIPDLSMIYTSKPLALYLSHNSITHVPVNAFTGIADKLKTIDLSYNRISTFQASFAMFTQIESLFLSHQSTNIPLVLPTSLRQTAGTLKELSVGGQKISKPDLWAVIGDMYMLEVLNLTSTELTNIPNFMLSNLTHLNKLDLSNNSLQNITQDTLAGPRNSLKLLILTRNLISTLLPCVLYQYTSYPISLFWGDNRLSCDCSVKWLWNSTRNGNIISIPGQEAVCSDNQPLANKCVEIFCASPYTEPQCFEYYTTTIAPSPKLTIVVETIDPDSIKISWQLSETSDDLKEFKINVADSYSVSPFFQTTIPASSTSQEVNKLVGKINYEVCVKAYFNIIPTLSSCTRTSVPGNSTLSEEQTPGLSQK